MKKNKELNLLTALNGGGRRRKAGKGYIATVAVLAVIAAAVALFFMYTINEGGKLTEKRDAALAYVNDPITHEQYSVSNSNKTAAAAAEVRSKAIVAAVEVVNSYPDMSGDDFRQLFDIAGKAVTMSNITYDRTTGALSFEGRCKSADIIPSFVSQLRASGIFADVNYEGYSGSTYTVPGKTNDDGTVSKDTVVTEYVFSVNCVVSAEGQSGGAETETPEADAGAETETPEAE
jgi:hypothetical protein